MNRLIFIAALCAAELSSIGLLMADERLDFFETKIRPVLVQHCYSCHAQDAKNVRDGLLLDSKAATLDGGESGAAVVPGKPDESLLLSALRHESFEMPPDQRLPDTVIADFEQWIRDGAFDPRAGGTKLKRHSIDLDEGRAFWSFQPLVRPDIPSVDTSWAQTDIDAFVYDKQQQAGLKPTVDATPEQIFRRLSFGLTGRPPKPDAMQAFVVAASKDNEGAIAAAVDGFLQSPAFGQHWGRYWLDVVRFAESSGGGRSLMFPHAWRFRDYVIQSFNDDKPFDQLVREHIAGDLLEAGDNKTRDEQITGVGYLTLGATNYEQQDKELLRMEVVDEQVDTMGRTFLGMTIGCARCHDHKFDPIPTADYYALAGIFRSTKTLTPGNVSGYVTASLQHGNAARAMKTWKLTENQLQAEIASLRQKLNPSKSQRQGMVAATTLPGIVVDDVDAVLEGSWTPSASVGPYVGVGYQHDDFGARDGRKVTFEIRVPRDGDYNVNVSYSPGTNRTPRAAWTIRHSEGQTVVNIDQRKRPKLDGLFHKLGSFHFRSDQTAFVSIDTDACGPGVVIVDAVQLLPVEPESPPEPPAGDSSVVSTKLEQLEQQLKKHQAARPEDPLVMAVEDEKQPADWHIHIRGGIRSLGPLVPRGGLSVVNAVDGQLSSPFDIRKPASGRLELANWLASPQNPLTARVIVNRIWLKLIGEGLVRTPDNFGKTGQPPTHPQLLDHLAKTFVQDDAWSMKSLIRRITTSRVYRLSSEVDRTSDPDNRLLCRGFRRRLEAEPLRDTILLLSGQLNTSVSDGRQIAKLTAYDNGYNHDQHSNTLPSVFVPAFRNSRLQFFEIFDAANPNLVVGKRTTSTLPAQALFLLNSPFMLEQSSLAAKVFLKELAPATSAEEKISQAWQRTIGRHPTTAEQAATLTFLMGSQQNEHDAWAAVFQSLFASVDFRYLD